MGTTKGAEGAGSLSLKDCGDRGRFLRTKTANVTPVFKKEDQGNYRLVSLFDLWEGSGTSPSRSHFQMYKDKKVLGKSQHGFMKEKLSLTKAFYKEMTSSVDKNSECFYL